MFFGRSSAAKIACGEVVPLRATPGADVVEPAARSAYARGAASIGDRVLDVEEVARLLAVANSVTIAFEQLDRAVGAICS